MDRREGAGESLVATLSHASEYFARRLSQWTFDQAFVDHIENTLLSAASLHAEREIPMLHLGLGRNDDDEEEGVKEKMAQEVDGEIDKELKAGTSFRYFMHESSEVVRFLDQCTERYAGLSLLI